MINYLCFFLAYLLIIFPGKWSLDNSHILAELSQQAKLISLNAQIEPRLKNIEAKIKNLENQTDNKIWYKDPSQISALGAFIVSLLALFFSSQSSREQEVRTKKEELRTLLFELIKLGEEFKSVERAEDDTEKFFLSSFANTKRMLLNSTKRQLKHQKKVL